MHARFTPSGLFTDEIEMFPGDGGDVFLGILGTDQADAQRQVRHLGTPRPPNRMQRPISALPCVAQHCATPPPPPPPPPPAMQRRYSSLLPRMRNDFDAIPSMEAALRLTFALNFVSPFVYPFVCVCVGGMIAYRCGVLLGACRPTTARWRTRG